MGLTNSINNLKMRQKVILFLIIIFIIIIAFFSIGIFSVYGSISGKVVPEESGIVVRAIQNGRLVSESTTNEEGSYVIPHLPRGVYGLLFVRGDRVFIYNNKGSAYSPASEFRVIDSIDLKSWPFASFDINLTDEYADYYSGVLLIQSKENITYEELSEALQSKGCSIKEKVSQFSPNRYYINIPADVTVFEQMEVIKEIPEIVYVNSVNVIYIGTW